MDVLAEVGREVDPASESDRFVDALVVVGKDHLHRQPEDLFDLIVADHLALLTAVHKNRNAVLEIERLEEQEFLARQME